MRFEKTRLSGAVIVHLEPMQDERGFFARSWCANEFAREGLDPRLVQSNISLNKKRGTLRGLHYQAEPHAEPKLVRCTHGAIYDVIADLRKESPTFKDWFGVELSRENRLALYVPKGMAHGFQTLEDDSEVLYQMGEFYAPEDARGIRWNDPAFAVEWPIDEKIISQRDAEYPGFER